MNRALLALLVVLVGAALVAGFREVGGPGQARMEHRDSKRIAHLDRISNHLQCPDETVALPDTLRSADYCGGRVLPEDVVDPLTGQDYEYRRLDASRFEICAQFETDISGRFSWVRRHQRLTIEGATGCQRWMRQTGDTDNWQSY